MRFGTALTIAAVCSLMGVSIIFHNHLLLTSSYLYRNPMRLKNSDGRSPHGPSSAPTTQLNASSALMARVALALSTLRLAKLMQRVLVGTTIALVALVSVKRSPRLSSLASQSTHQDQWPLHWASPRVRNT